MSAHAQVKEREGSNQSVQGLQVSEIFFKGTYNLQSGLCAEK